jgi:hypothetical protein
MQRLFYAMVLLTALMIGACAGRSDPQLTLVAENLALSTQITDIRNTATYAADKLNMTAEFVGTAVIQGDKDNQLLAVTLTAAGIDPSQVTPGAFAPTSLPINNNVPSTTDEAGSGGSNPALITPTPPPTASLYNIVLAEGVGANDCALSAVSSFTTSTERIYVVATAANIPSNTKLSSRWFLEGTEVVAHDFTPDFNIDQNCIWFFIDQVDTPFTPGNWSVQLNINDQPAGPPVNFTITG